MHSELKRDLNNIAEITYQICGNGDSYIQAQKGYEKALVRSLRDIVDYDSLLLLLEKEDIEQEIYSLYLKFLNDYNTKTPNASLRSYVISRTIWEVRDWINKLYNSQYPTYTLSVADRASNDPEFKLDLLFLIKGTDLEPFCILNPYERNIVYLYYTREKTLQEVSTLTGRSVPIIRKYIRSILEKLRRRNYVSTGNTSRPR